MKQSGMKRNRHGSWIVGALAVATIAACGADRTEEVAVVDRSPADEAARTADASPTGAAAAPSAVAVLQNSQGQEVGRATFTQEGETVVITVDARNVQGGQRAIHIHETGSCVPPSFESAGDHFNPDDRAHGFDHPQGPHAGDLRNLIVDPDDNLAHETYRTDRVTLVPGRPNSLLDGDGTALVIHAEADDYVSQPSGEAGDPVICGVITAA